MRFASKGSSLITWSFLVACRSGSVAHVHCFILAKAKKDNAYIYLAWAFSV
jgi:hypothetical protein